MTNHLEIYSGDLFDMRQENPFSAPPLRARYSWHHIHINSLADLKATLRAGPYSWPGCYEVVFYTQDGGTLCHDCTSEEFPQIAYDWLHDISTGWKVVAADTVEGDEEITCDHCSKCMS